MKNKIYLSLAVLAATLAMITSVGFAGTPLNGQTSQTMLVSANSGGTPPVTMVSSSVDTKFTAQAQTATMTDSENPGTVHVAQNSNLNDVTTLTAAGITDQIAGACNALDASTLTGSRAEITPSNARGYAALTDAGSEGNYHNGKIGTFLRPTGCGMTLTTT